MNKEEIQNFKFGDSEIDNMDDFNLSARDALIQRAINKEEYMIIENLEEFLRSEFRKLGSAAKCVAKNIMESFVDSR